MKRIGYTELTCYHCGKGIEGRAIHYTPRRGDYLMGWDFPRAYHPICWEKLDVEANTELFRKLVNRD